MLAVFARKLCEEAGYRGVEDESAATLSEPNQPQAEMFMGLLGPEEERLVAAAREALASIQGALEARHARVVSEAAHRALLDGAEVVMRNELRAGKSILDLMPSFVFLIALPLVDQDKALDLSRRTSSVLAELRG